MPLSENWLKSNLESYKTGQSLIAIPQESRQSRWSNCELVKPLAAAPLPLGFPALSRHLNPTGATLRSLSLRARRDARCPVPPAGCGGRSGLISAVVLHPFAHSWVPADQTAPPTFGAVESGPEPGRREPGWTEVGAPPWKSRIRTSVIGFRAYW